MGYINPLLDLPAGQALQQLPPGDRARIEAVMRELRAQANEEADRAWARRKGPMAAYWRAVATYSRHIAHALSSRFRPAKACTCTAPTPSRADALIREHRASMHPETLRAWASDAVDELGRLQTENERLLAELEAHKPLPPKRSSSAWKPSRHAAHTAPERRTGRPR